MDPQAQGIVDQRLVQWKALDLPENTADEPAPATDPAAAATPAAEEATE